MATMPSATLPGATRRREARGAVLAGYALVLPPLTQAMTATVSIKGSPRLARVLATLRAAPASRGRYAPLTLPFATDFIN